MEAVGQLTGGLAHDFNNLLTGITGALEILKKRMTEGRSSEADYYIGAAQAAAERAAALTHRLLAFARRQPLDPKSIRVDGLVAGMNELIQRTVGPGIRVAIVDAIEPWNAWVDPNQLENALLNLCINARDAMPSGGDLLIKICNHEFDQGTTAEHDLSAGQYLSLCVRDTGTGMSAAVIGKAFEPLFTTKPIGEGTGLGLSMVYGFARQSGGHVRIDSEIGVGTQVWIYLPRHRGALVDADESLDSKAALPAGRGETVLVVDDDPTVRRLVTEVLKDTGYNAISAADCVAGLKIVQSDQRIDLLVADIGLPGGFDGRQLGEAARASRAELRVLFITGYSRDLSDRTGHSNAYGETLMKPFAMRELAARVSALLRSV